MMSIIPIMSLSLAGSILPVTIVVIPMQHMLLLKLAGMLASMEAIPVGG